MREYNFVKRFGRCPGGRSREEGPLSGQEFFEDILRPFSTSGERVVLDLTGAMGFATSFLDGAFGEFGKQLGFDAFYAMFEIRATDDVTLPEEIKRAIQRGDKERFR